MDQNSCRTCVYFRQHYAFDQRKLFRVYCVHCVFQRVKTKRPDSKACENYIYSESNEQAFATKEYLSKVLLEYMFNLELLPEIYDMEY